MYTDTPLTTTHFNNIYKALFDVRTSWQDIGLELQVDPETIRSIFREMRGNDADALKEMLLCRLKCSTTPALTWKLIIDSLRVKTVARDDVANTISKELNE